MAKMMMETQKKLKEAQAPRGSMVAYFHKVPATLW
jgi:hypothetical protein